MVGVRLEGRLGNQLFQYAFILAVSGKLDTHFFVDQYIELSIVDLYFTDTRRGSFVNRLWAGTVSKLFRITGFKNFFSFYLRRFYYRYFVLIARVHLVKYSYAATATAITIKEDCLYHGYFQSESFFNEYEALVRERFVLKNEFADSFKQKFGDFYGADRVVTVHIRRTDYQNLGHLGLGGNDLSLPLNYYKKAISKFDGQKVHFVFISDDRDFVIDNFSGVPNKTISMDDEITDFQHLMNADACIISNSTFSWWGAWLNKKPDKVVFAPMYFMGWRIKEETPLEIYPDSWKVIDF